MDQREKRVYLMQQLLNEKKEYRTMPIPDEEEEQKKLLRSLTNIRQTPCSQSGFSNRTGFLFASVHLKEAFCMDSIKKQSVCIKAD